MSKSNAMVDMSGSLPVGHFLALTAAVRHLHEEMEHWQKLPPWLCLTTPSDASALKAYLASVCESLEPTARQLAAEHGPQAPAPKLTLIQGEDDAAKG